MFTNCSILPCSQGFSIACIQKSLKNIIRDVQILIRHVNQTRVRDKYKNNLYINVQKFCGKTKIFLWKY